MAERSRIDKVSGEYFRKGRCEVCGKGAERTKTFSGLTMDAVRAQAKAWESTPLVHKRCEGVLR